MSLKTVNRTNPSTIRQISNYPKFKDYPQEDTPKISKAIPNFQLSKHNPTFKVVKVAPKD